MIDFDVWFCGYTPTMSNIRLVNDKRSILDLSAVKDAEGKMVILQPKDAKGSSRECTPDVAHNPHVVSVIEARWAHIEKINLTVPREEAQAPEPTHTEPSLPSPPPAVTLPPALTIEPVAPPQEDAPVDAPEAPHESAPPAAEEAPIVEASPEVLEVSEGLSTNVNNSNDGRGKNKNKGRNDR